MSRVCTSGPLVGSASHGHTDEAVTHLLAAGSTSDAARLVHANWLTYVDVGRAATVLELARSARHTVDRERPGGGCHGRVDGLSGG